MDKATKKGLYWHVHHDVLMEYCYDYDERVRFIRLNKLKKEIKLRLKLMKPVKGKIPIELRNAARAVHTAWQKYEDAADFSHVFWRKWTDARYKYCSALKKRKAVVNALHKKECPKCSWNGTQIVF